MKWIIIAWKWLLGWFIARLTTWNCEQIDDDPEAPRPQTVYLVGDPGRPWKAMLVCPCGCGAVIELNLSPPGQPMWRVHVDPKGRATVHPSVWRRVGCRSHFWVRNGLIVWASDGDDGPAR